ncbi:endonuclease/exonuclease/phosphatase family protein [Thermopolyspora sp. NPDC052614]|uniref:endonuclease/exonuclease/phosphatase family protein n=1 Tax=Thermopolyspora sp. NPDC052614 TaxID=3155682 RepID=UPI00342AE907
MSLRVASYNVRSLRDDVGALVRVIRAIEPDVLCLQEAPTGLRWRRGRDRLAERVGMTVVAGRRKGGLAILAGPGVRAVHAEYHLLSPRPRLQRRALAIAVVDKDGRRAAVGCVHLDLSATARLEHVAEIEEHMAWVRDRFGVPDALAGDFNEEPTGAAWRRLTRRYTDCFAAAPDGHGGTFTARHPAKRIDAIFAGPGLAVRSCGVPQADPADLAVATDHLPVQADLLFPA